MQVWITVWNVRRPAITVDRAFRTVLRFDARCRFVGMRVAVNRQVVFDVGVDDQQKDNGSIEFVVR